MKSNEKLTKEQLELVENIKEQAGLQMLEISKAFEKFQKEFEQASASMQKILDKLKKQIFE